MRQSLSLSMYSIAFRWSSKTISFFSCCCSLTAWAAVGADIIESSLDLRRFRFVPALDLVAVHRPLSLLHYRHRLFQCSLVLLSHQGPVQPERKGAVSPSNKDDSYKQMVGNRQIDENWHGSRNCGFYKGFHYTSALCIPSLVSVLLRLGHQVWSMVLCNPTTKQILIGAKSNVVNGIIFHWCVRIRLQEFVVGSLVWELPGIKFLHWGACTHVHDVGSMALIRPDIDSSVVDTFFGNALSYWTLRSIFPCWCFLLRRNGISRNSVLIRYTLGSKKTSSHHRPCLGIRVWHRGDINNAFLLHWWWRGQPNLSHWLEKCCCFLQF